MTELGIPMIADYDFRLVVLSMGIAAIASYASLDLAGRVTAAQGWARVRWLVGSAMVMGIGIWSMHFIGMLAYMLPVAIAYDLWRVLASMTVAIIASGIAFFIVSRQQMTWVQLVAGAILMGSGIAAMHYIGMAAMELEAVPHYNPTLVALSLAIAMGASLIALRFSFDLRSQTAWMLNWRKLVSAIVMGSAIAGMHYTAMAAVTFEALEQSFNPASNAMDNRLLAIAIALATIFIMVLALLASFINLYINAKTARAEALRQSEERFRFLVQNSSDLITLVSADGIIQYKSPSVKRLLGYEPEELVGKDRYKYIHPEDIPVVSAALYKIIQSPGSAIIINNRFRHKNGSWVYLESIASNLINAPTVKGIVINSRDITERKQAELSIQQQAENERRLNTELEQQVQERTAQLQQAINFDSMLKRITDKVRDSLDENQILHTAVKELASMLEIAGCNIILEDAAQPNCNSCYQAEHDSDLLMPCLVRIRKNPQANYQLLQGQSFQFCLSQALENSVTVLACPILDDREKLGDLWLWNNHDYAFSDLEIRLVEQVANQCAIAIRQARLYQAVQAQVAELETLNRLKDDFLSTISHELRTPITNMKMALQMLELTLRREGTLLASSIKSQANASKTSRYFQILHNECKRESMLIDDLLDLQRLDSGVPAIVLTGIHIENLITQVLEPFQERMHQRQQHLIVDIAPDLPVIVSDPASLERILAELLQNACKYTSSGETITVKAAMRSDKIELSVTNSGVEISAHEQSRIFEKFYRIPSGDPWKQGGTGLGLALVKKFVEYLEGQISVKSEFGKTCFTVELPIKRGVLKQAVKQSSGVV